MIEIFYAKVIKYMDLYILSFLVLIFSLSVCCEVNLLHLFYVPYLCIFMSYFLLIHFIDYLTLINFAICFFYYQENIHDKGSIILLN